MAVESLTAQELAERCAEVLMQRDDASRHLQMNVESVSPGTATITMSVQDYMIQGHGSCHGGYIFSLADTAFAFACNFYLRKVKNLAQQKELVFSMGRLKILINIMLRNKHL